MALVAEKPEEFTPDWVDQTGGKVPPLPLSMCGKRKGNKEKAAAKEEDGERLPEARSGVLISGSEERGSAQREKTSAPMTTAARGSEHTHIKTSTEAGQMEERHREDLHTYVCVCLLTLT